MQAIGHRKSARLALTCLATLGTAGAQLITAPWVANTSPWVAWGNVMSVKLQRADGWQAKIGDAAQSTSAVPTFKHALAKTDFKFQGRPTQQRACAPNDSTTAERQQLTALCLQLFDAIEATPGFRKANLAASLTVLLGLSLQVYAGEELSDAAGERLQRVLNEMLIETGLYAELAPADVQAFYETSIMTGGLILTLAEQGRLNGNATLTNTAKDLAGAVLRSFGFDF